MDDSRRTALAAWLGVEITGMSLLSGGAIQQNWRLDVVQNGTPQAWVLRTDNAVTLSVSRSRPEEFYLLKAAFAAGVTVPEPLFLCTDTTVIGTPFFVMRRVDGIAAGFRVVKSDTLGGGREKLAARLGLELARIHAIPAQPQLDFLASAGEPHRRFVADMRRHLDIGRRPRPMLEWGLRYLERTMPDSHEIVMCHNDFRTGNFIASEETITGILDWEFAAWGDPHEDLGWLCAKCWRFGSPYEVGGVGPRAPFYAAYEAASGRLVDADKMRWWELAATIRWAVIAIDQAERHISGQEASLELALTGHIVPELELDIMRATP